MDDAKRKIIQENLDTLDYLKGTGVISTHKRKLADERYLFISTGGNGHKLLTTLRHQLEWQVDASEVAKKIRFLAVDTCHKEMEDLKLEGFDATEFLKLPHEGAHESIAPTKITPQMKQWIYPDLYSKTGGMAKSSPSLSGFDTTGAGAWRQPGRVRLCQPNTLEMLTSTLKTAIHTLAVGKSLGARLNVFFLAGLAGGTGSGTIVDLAFLARHIIKEKFPALYKDTQVSAYLLLPSACGTDDNTKGDRNAYAALKEIDYFMGLQERGETYCEQYKNGYDVEISENIFDFCTLVEGIADGGILYDDPADTARHVTANSILNLITVPEAKPGEVRPFLVDAFLSNKTQQVGTAVKDHSHRDWPRNANYTYNVIGYSCCVVPIDLITVCVAKEVFDQVWELFERCGEVTEQDVDDFLDSCMLRPAQLHKLASRKTIEQCIVAQADAWFQKKGPYYMVNLIDAAIDVIKTDYILTAERKSTRLDFNGTWAKTARRYHLIVDEILLPMNNKWYHVYTEVIDRLKELLKENAELLTETAKFESVFKQSFHWSPIDLTRGKNASNTIKKYLDNLIPEREIKSKADRFIKQMCSMKDVWTQLEPPKGKNMAAFEVAQFIRKFVEEEFTDCINTTMEDFLIKLYSGDPNARVPELSPEDDPRGYQPVKEAAETIVQRLSQEASAMVQTSDNFYLNDCASNVYITVPDGCKLLPDAIADYASSNNITSKRDIYCSSSKSEVVLYRIYAGVPAWALNWIDQAERSYEIDPEECGLHIEQYRDGWKWSDFPSLSFEYDLSESGQNRRRREQKLINLAEADLERARELGLVECIPGAGVEEYELRLLKSTQMDSDALWPRISLPADRECSRAELYAQMEEAGLIRRVPLKYVNAEINTTEDPIPEKLGWELAFKSLRHMMKTWNALKSSFDLISELTAKLDKHNTAVRILKRAEERQMTFLACLAHGLLQYRPARQRWYSYVGNETPLGDELEKPFERECKEYYGAQAFYMLEDADYQTFADAVSLKEHGMTDEEMLKMRDQRKQLKSTYAFLRKQVNVSDEPDIRFPMASEKFEKALGADKCKEIRDFYDWIIDNM